MSLSDFEILQKLGDGSYSTVYKVRRISDSQIYALKKVRMQKLKAKEKKNALTEVRILASIQSSHVVSYKEAFFDEGCLCVVMEFADAGDLYQRIRQYSNKKSYMSEGFVWSFFIQIVQGLKALHDLQVLHRDIKSANVFLNKTGTAKLGDMNVSKVAEQGLLHTQTGTPYYASPEVWQDKPYGFKSDIWSLGCVLYESICLKPPFRADNMQGLFKQVVKGQYQPIPKQFSKDLTFLLAQLLNVDPTKRPTCEEILKFPAVQRHLLEEFEEGKNQLLGSIELPKNIKHISLPKPNYSRSEAGLSTLSDKKLQRSVQTPTQRKLHDIMKENYGALKLPKLKYPAPRNAKERAQRIQERYIKYASPKPMMVPAHRAVKGSYVRPSWWG